MNLLLSLAFVSLIISATSFDIDPTDDGTLEYFISELFNLGGSQKQELIREEVHEHADEVLEGVFSLLGEGFEFETDLNEKFNQEFDFEKFQKVIDDIFGIGSEIASQVQQHSVEINQRIIDIVDTFMGGISVRNKRSSNEPQQHNQGPLDIFKDIFHHPSKGQEDSPKSSQDEEQKTKAPVQRKKSKRRKQKKVDIEVQDESGGFETGMGWIKDDQNIDDAAVKDDGSDKKADIEVQDNSGGFEAGMKWSKNDSPDKDTDENIDAGIFEIKDDGSVNEDDIEFHEGNAEIQFQQHVSNDDDEYIGDELQKKDKNKKDDIEFHEGSAEIQFQQHISNDDEYIDDELQKKDKDKNNDNELHHGKAEIQFQQHVSNDDEYIDDELQKKGKDDEHHRRRTWKSEEESDDHSTSHILDRIDEKFNHLTDLVQETGEEMIEMAQDGQSDAVYYTKEELKKRETHLRKLRKDTKDFLKFYKDHFVKIVRKFGSGIWDVLG